MGEKVDKNAVVLIVEDDPNLRKILVAIVKKLGFSNIREAENGQKAWMTINNATIGLLLTDLNMPVMDGLQLSRMVRANPQFNHIPILVITAADTKETIVKAGKSGVDGYIIKPFDIKQIVGKIESSFSHRASVNAKKEV